MITKKVKQVERHKAFIGAVIGAAANVIGNIISNKKKQKAEEAQFRQQQAEQVRQEGVKQANAITQSLNDQDYVDEYRKRITLKNGGKVKTNYTDRIKRNKAYACGGRKKASLGIGDAMQGIGNLATAIVTKQNAPKQITVSDGFSIDTNKGLTPNSYQIDEYGKPVIQARFGTIRKHKKC